MVRLLRQLRATKYPDTRLGATRFTRPASTHRKSIQTNQNNARQQPQRVISLTLGFYIVYLWLRLLLHGLLSNNRDDPIRKEFFPWHSLVVLLLCPLLATIIVTDALKYLFMSLTITLVIQVRDVLRVENKNYWISNWLADPRERDLEEMGLHVCTIYKMSLVTPCFSHCLSRVKFSFIYFRASLTIGLSRISRDENANTTARPWNAQNITFRTRKNPFRVAPPQFRLCREWNPCYLRWSWHDEDEEHAAKTNKCARSSRS